MKVKEIGHLAFTCADLNASIEYYRDKLGLSNKFSITYAEFLEHVKKQPNADPAQMEYLASRGNDVWITYFETAGGQFVELFDQGKATISRIPTDSDLNYAHVAMLVEDIHAAHEELLAKGAPIDSPPSLGMEGTWQMWSHDPDGNKIEFMQYTETSWQLTGR